MIGGTADDRRCGGWPGDWPRQSRSFLECAADDLRGAVRPSQGDLPGPYRDGREPRSACAGVPPTFQALGVAAGDRVALLTVEKRPFLAAHLGALYAGAVALPLNPRFTRDELRYFLADSGAVAAVVGDGAAAGGRVAPRPSCPSSARSSPMHEVGDPPAAATALSRPRPGGRRPLPDALQLGHDRPAQGGRPHARQPRLQPAGLAGLLAVHARRRAGQRPAAVPHPRPLVRHPPEPARRRLPARSRTSFHPRRTLDVVGQGTVFMAIPTFYYAFLERPEFPEAAQALGERPPLHLRLGADPARGAAGAGVDPGPAGHQPLRDDRGARDHQPAARRPLAAGLGRPAARRESRSASRATTARPRRPARSARCRSAARTCSASTGASPRPPARRSPPAGSTPATSAARRAGLPHPRRPQERPDHHQRLQRLSAGRRAGAQRLPGRQRVGRARPARPAPRRAGGGRRRPRRPRARRA